MRVAPRLLAVTGAPGAGKTTFLSALARRGWPVVREAATDVVAAGQALGDPEPWTRSGFTDDVLARQLERQRDAIATTQSPFNLTDRSPLCTLALATHLAHTPSRALLSAVDAMTRSGEWIGSAFFLDDLGWIETTPVRQISHVEAQRFGVLHASIYQDHGFELIRIPAGPLEERVGLAEMHISALHPRQRR